MKTLIVSLHDVHPGSYPLIAGQLRALESWGVKETSMLVVPEFHHQYPVAEDASFCRAITQNQQEGHELVLHGYYHDRLGLAEEWQDWFWTRLYTNQEAEFLNLSEMEALERLALGKKIFADLGWHATGFIAPAWLLPDRLLSVLQQAGFQYTNRLREIIPLSEEKPRVAATSLCYSTRAWWRRSVSQMWNHWLFSQLKSSACLRLSLHPHDLEFSALRQQIEWCVKTALQLGFRPTTYAGYVAR